MSERADDLGVNVIGDFTSSTGLAEAARRSVLALRSAGIDLHVTDVSLGAPRAADRVSPEIQALPRDRLADIDIHFENVNEFTQFDDDLVHPPGRSQYAIASWYWELPELNWEFLPGVAKVDEIWVASEYVQQVFARATDVPVTVIPAVVEGVHSTAYDRRHFGLPERSCLFLFNFDAASSYARKNPLGLVEAFARAFPPEDRGTRATLVIKALRLEFFPPLQRAVAAAVAEVGGVLIASDLSGEEMTSLLACADVYVSLHRSEGFGLGMAEAMRLGKPVVCTAYSANIDFCTLQNSRQVGYRMIEVTDSDHAFHPAMTGLYRAGQLWADPDLDQAAWWMRDLLEHPRERARLGLLGQSAIFEHHSREAAGRAMRARLEEIAAGR